MTNDIINGIFEVAGGVFLIANCFRLYKDKTVQGVSVSVTAFFSVWGFWNLFYYPSLGQWWSFFGGVLLVAANSVWVGMALRYSRRRK
jgi:uncharacterized membrane protein YfcA